VTFSTFISVAGKLKPNSHCRAAGTPCNWYSPIGHTPFNPPIVSPVITVTHFLVLLIKNERQKIIASVAQLLLPASLTSILDGYVNFKNILENIYKVGGASAESVDNAASAPSVGPCANLQRSGAFGSRSGSPCRRATAGTAATTGATTFAGANAAATTRFGSSCCHSAGGTNAASPNRRGRSEAQAQTHAKAQCPSSTAGREGRADARASGPKRENDHNE
jgi:hypothetical protein